MLLLFQMADSAFPVGGFAYSYGMESAVKHGFFADQDALREYLITFSDQLISFDFAFVCSAYQLGFINPSPKNILGLIQDYEAMLLNPPIQKANCVIGKNWMRICKQLSNSSSIDELEMTLVKNQIAYEFPVIFGLSMQSLKIPLSQILNLFFYMSLRDQISAMIRLGVAGPVRAHMELHSLMKIFKLKIENYKPVSHQEAFKSAYLMEIAQLKHEKVYSKLFQN